VPVVTRVAERVRVAVEAARRRLAPLNPVGFYLLGVAATLAAAGLGRLLSPWIRPLTEPVWQWLVDNVLAPFLG
jgi:hypothetical protein